MPRLQSLVVIAATGLLLSACAAQKPATTPTQAPAPVTPPPPVAASRQYLAVGDEAPIFALPDQSGIKFNFADYKGKRNTLLFFHMGTG